MENLVKLSQALRRMNAMIRTEDEAVPARLDAEFLANMPLMLNLVDDIIESKRAANRAKDHRALPYLESLREIRQTDS